MQCVTLFSNSRRYFMFSTIISRHNVTRYNVCAHWKRTESGSSSLSVLMCCRTSFFVIIPSRRLQMETHQWCDCETCVWIFNDVGIRSNTLTHYEWPESDADRACGTCRWPFPLASDPWWLSGPRNTSKGPSAYGCTMMSEINRHEWNADHIQDPFELDGNGTSPRSWYVRCKQDNRLCRSAFIDSFRICYRKIHFNRG